MAYQTDRITSIPAPLPKDYDRGFSFTDFQTINPGDPMPGASLDNELAKIEQALDETQARARLIQRDDGALANSSVGLEQLKPESYNALSGTGVIQLSDITSLSGLNTAALVDGQQFSFSEVFWPDAGVGDDAVWEWQASASKTGHNGVDKRDPDKVSELNTTNKTFGSWFTPAGSGTGLLVRKNSGSLDFSVAGGHPDADSSVPWPFFVAAAGSDLVMTASGEFNSTATLHIPSNPRFGNFEGANFNFADGVFRGFTLGDEGANPMRGIIVGLSAVKTNYEGAGEVGIALINAVETAFESPRSIGWQISYGLIPSNSSRVAYNDIYSPLGQNHKTGILIQGQDGTSYANENTVHGGRLASFVSGRLEDHIVCNNLNGTGAGHNRFLGVSIEGFSGGGSTGRSGFRCINNANENIALFCRAEKYGTGWTDAAYYFGSGTVNNRAVDSRIDADFIDLGNNNFESPVEGIYRQSVVSAGEGSPGFRYRRNTPQTDDANKYLLDIADTYSGAGKVGALKYVSPRTESRAGSLVYLETGYGAVFDMDDAGSIKPRDNFSDLGTDSNRYRSARIRDLGSLTNATFVNISAASAPNNSVFVDSADGVLKFKNSAGIVNALY